MSFFKISLVHTAVAVIVILLFAILMKVLRVSPDRWTVGKDILFLGCILFCIGIGQFFIRDFIYDNPNNWSVRYLIEEVRNTFLIGILFIIILVPLNQNRLSTKFRKRASKYAPLSSVKPNSTALQIKTQVKQDDFELDPNTLLFAKADRNYVELYILEGELYKKVLKRISLSQLENQLAHISHILKTHRSFLVNLNFIEEVSGNAQGYSLKLQQINTPIAVSRKMIPSFEKKFGNA